MQRTRTGTIFQLAMAIDVIDEAIRQIMFHPNLLIYCALAVTIISLATKSILKSQNLEAPRGKYKWINHPLDPNSLIAFELGTVHVWSWHGLVETARLSFDCPSTSHGSSTSHSEMSSSTNLWESKESVDRVLITRDKTFFLLQCSCPSSQGQKQKATLLFDVLIIPIAASPNPPSHSTHKQPRLSKTSVSSPHLGSD